LMQKPPLVGARLDLVLFARKLVDDRYAVTGNSVAFWSCADPVWTLAL
jgi:hypothetical protein